MSATDTMDQIDDKNVSPKNVDVHADEEKGSSSEVNGGDLIVIDHVDPALAAKMHLLNQVCLHHRTPSKSR